MQIIDITQEIKNGMPVWPGDPPVNLAWLSEIAKNGPVNLTELSMSAHTGTHLDAPSHFIDHGKTLDDLDLSAMVGPARVEEVAQEVKVIDESFLRRLPLTGVSRLLLKTSNSLKANVEPSEFHQDYVALDASGARFLAESNFRLIGIDAFSIACFDDPEGGHLPLLEKGIAVLEGLNLHGVAPGDYYLAALPLKLAGREGAPVRAILIKDFTIV